MQRLVLGGAMVLVGGCFGTYEVPAGHTEGGSGSTSSAGSTSSSTSGSSSSTSSTTASPTSSGSTGSGSTTGVPEDCDPVAQDCPDGWRCTLTNDYTDTTCVEGDGTVPHGSMCSTGNPDDCVKGTICAAPPGETVGLCRAFCNDVSPCGPIDAGFGTTCLPILAQNANRVCFGHCPTAFTTDNMACPMAQGCVAQFMGGEPRAFLCEFRTPGAVAFGGNCMSAADCDFGPTVHLDCIAGQCLTWCDTTNPTLCDAQGGTCVAQSLSPTFENPPGAAAYGAVGRCEP